MNHVRSLTSSSLVRRALRILGIGVLAMGAILLGQPSPYARLDPGPVSDVSSGVTGTGLKDVHGDKDGTFHMLTVDVGRVTWFEYIVAKIPGTGVETAKVDLSSHGRKVSDQTMDASKQTAGLLAERFVSGSVSSLKADGAVIIDVRADSPAERSGLKRGDVIVEMDGTQVATSAEVAMLVKTAEGSVDVVVRRGQNRLAFVVSPESGVIGVQVDTQYRGSPVITVGTPGVGGASAGLVMTLAFIDALSPGDLTSGKLIAATGTVDAAGRVGAIRGLRQKLEAARDIPAALIFIPTANKDEVGVAEDIVPVSSVEDAVRELCRRGSSDDVCRRYT